MPVFKDYFSADAAGYARARPHYPPALAAWLAARAPARDCALDVACGSGQLSVSLAAHFARVIGCDASAAQIAAARPDPRIDYRCAPAEATGLPAASVDLVTVAQAAHWLDLPAFYAEVRRVARPHALLALISYGVTTLPGAPGEVLATFYWQRIHDDWPPERHAVETGYRDLPFPFPALAAPVLAMEADWTLDELLAYVATWSAVRAARKAGRGALFEHFAGALADAWGAPARRLRVRWPLALRVGRVEAAGTP